MPEKEDLLDDIFGDEDIDVGKMEDERKQRREAASKGSLRYIRAFYLNADQNVGLVSFLNEGFKIHVHDVPFYHNGTRMFQTILCKRKGCPICATGNNSREQAMYGLVDWLHAFKDSSGQQRRVPTFKYFVKGLNTIKMIERRRKKFDTLLGRKWEVTREGKGYDTYYDFMPEEEFTPDFSATREIETKDGPKTVPEIAIPQDWPATDDKDGNPIVSLYTQQLDKLRPERKPDFSNPDDVTLWLKCHFANTPESFYTNFGSSQQQSPGSSPAPTGDDDDSDDDLY